MDGRPQIRHVPDSARRIRASAPKAAAALGDPVPWGWIDLLKIMGLFLLLAIVTVIILAVIHALLRSPLKALLPLLHAWGLSDRLAGILALGFLIYGLLALAIYVCIVLTYQLGLPALGFRPARPSNFVLAVVAWPVVGIVGGAATALVAQLFLGGHYSNPQTRDYSNTGATRSMLSLVLLFTLLALVTPMVEETLFRGLLFPLLRRKLPYAAAIPACALIFALAHGIPILIPWLFTMGLALTLLFARTKSLYPGMLLHAIQNAAFAVAIWTSFG
jgi:membrane protease YdiL (CAAX protease family)